ncbi:hypothetical protein EJB05_42095, partial [Eragrostis curvula]
MMIIIWLRLRLIDIADQEAQLYPPQDPRGVWWGQPQTRPPRPPVHSLPPPAARRRPPLLVDPFSDLDGQQRRLPQPVTAAFLPAFAYTKSSNSKVTAGTGEEEAAAATCSVCLGAFEFGEMVRLLPVCLHLFHVECIDMWLAAHTTCPVCRSGTDPTQMTMDIEQLPPV